MFEPEEGRLTIGEGRNKLSLEWLRPVEAAVALGDDVRAWVAADDAFTIRLGAYLDGAKDCFGSGVHG